MSMVTRCPACATGFRVTSQQLRAHAGTVRCGRCATVFNAFDSLGTLPDAPDTHAELQAPPHSDEVETPPMPEAVAPPVPEPPALAPADSPAAAPLVSEPVAVFPPEPTEAQYVANASPEAFARETAGEGDEPPPAGRSAGPEVAEQWSAEPEPVPKPRIEGTPPAAIDDFTLVYTRRGLRAGSAGWLAGALLLALLLAAQLAYRFRSEIAATFPGTRPVLESVCALFGCAVALPRQVEQWSIEASDLQADTGRPSLVTLSAALRNRANFTQAFPTLELTLTDSANHPLARRVLSAEEYLPKGTDPKPGLGADSEVQVHVMLETGNLNPAGYGLLLFYP